MRRSRTLMRTSVTRDLKPFLPGRTLKRITLNLLGEWKFGRTRKCPKLLLPSITQKICGPKMAVRGDYFGVTSGWCAPFQIWAFFGQKEISSTPEWVCQTFMENCLLGEWFLTAVNESQVLKMMSKTKAERFEDIFVRTLVFWHWRFVKTWVNCKSPKIITIGAGSKVMDVSRWWYWISGIWMNWYVGLRMWNDSSGRFTEVWFDREIWYLATKIVIFAKLV